MSFTVQFFNEPDLQPTSLSERLFHYDLLDVSINGLRQQFRNGVSDLGTIPGLLNGAIQNDDPHWIRAFILHDRLCDGLGELGLPFPHYSSIEAAAILRAGGLADQSETWKADAIFIAVIAGGPHWK